MSNHTAEMQALADEYRMLLRQAEEARECGNRQGESDAHFKMHKNYMAVVQIDIDMLKENMGLK